MDASVFSTPILPVKDNQHPRILCEFGDVHLLLLKSHRTPA